MPPKRHFILFNPSFSQIMITITKRYGTLSPATTNELGETGPSKCSLTVFLCAAEAFFGLLYSALCAAIFFGKITRVQSHASLFFCNAVCVQYLGDSNCFKDTIDDSYRSALNEKEEREETVDQIDGNMHNRKSQVERMSDCPILKFQVVNEVSSNVSVYVNSTVETHKNLLCHITCILSLQTTRAARWWMQQ